MYIALLLHTLGVASCHGKRCKDARSVDLSDPTFKPCQCKTKIKAKALSDEAHQQYQLLPCVRKDENQHVNSTCAALVFVHPAAVQARQQSCTVWKAAAAQKEKPHCRWQHAIRRARLQPPESHFPTQPTHDKI
ncbi:hypothetical protein COO60DRAFT_1525745, partial [Scenedesmus sp. NREL 46B-D3]